MYLEVKSTKVTSLFFFIIMSATGTPHLSSIVLLSDQLRTAVVEQPAGHQVVFPPCEGTQYAELASARSSIKNLSTPSVVPILLWQFKFRTLRFSPAYSDTSFQFSRPYLKLYFIRTSLLFSGENWEASRIFNTLKWDTRDYTTVYVRVRALNTGRCLMEIEKLWLHLSENFWYSSMIS